MTVRVGILGCGFIARYHAMQLKLAAEPNEIVAVHDLDPGRAAAFVELEGGTAMASVDEVVAASDAVFVCTWTASHLAAVESVARGGRPVFCEKPLGIDLVDAAAVAAAASTSPFDMVGLVLRTSPALLALRELVLDPAAGRIMNVVFRDDQFIPTQGMYQSDWRGDPARAGSGALLEHSIHDVDILEWLGGPFERVSALQAYFHGIEGIEDSVTVVGRYASGAGVALTSIWHDILDRPSQRRIEVFCERRLVTLGGDLFGPVSVHSDNESFTIDGDGLVNWLVGRDVPLVSSEQTFLEAVAASTAGTRAAGTDTVLTVRLRPDVCDALRAHVVVDAVYRSARAGGDAVVVPPPDGVVGVAASRSRAGR